MRPRWARTTPCRADASPARSPWSRGRDARGSFSEPARPWRCSSPPRARPSACWTYPTSRAAETVAHVQAIGGQAIALKADVRERDQCQAAVAALVSAFGGLNILVNNTGVSRKARSLDDITDVDWDFVMDVNVKGVVNVSAAALPHLSGAGSIINVSSIAAQLGMGGLAYSASKGGVLSLTRAMARELGPQNIRVNCVVPGHIIAPMMRPEPEYREALLERLMLGYQGTAWDVAWAAVYLASDEARWITAEILQVDGGSPVSGPMPKPR